jgi:hypothetical protein
MIADDNDTDDKFLASINDTGEQLSPVTTADSIEFGHWRWRLVCNPPILVAH